jgi:hypothetical protein
MPIKMCHNPDMRTMAKTIYEWLSIIPMSEYYVLKYSQESYTQET